MINKGIILSSIIAFILGHKVAHGTCLPMGESGHTDCQSGEYWDLTNSDCLNCRSGYYCPGGGLAYCCPAPFNNSEIGSDAITDCYADVSCEENGPTYQVYCQDSGDHHTCALNTYGNDTYYETQWTYDNNFSKLAYIPLLNALDFFDANNNELIINSRDGYHIEVRQTYNSADAGNHGSGSNWYWPGTPMELKCTRNEKSCSTFRNFAPTTCNQNTTHGACNNNSNCQWINTGQGTGLCVNNDAIDSVASTATNCPSEYNVTGDAYWTWNEDNPTVNSSGYWNVSECKCDMGQNQWLDDLENHCVKNGHTIRNALGLNPNAPINTVHSIFENVIFDPNDSIENTSAVCRRCVQDDPSQNKYYYVQDQYGNNPGGFINGHVTHCTSGNFIGYYRPTACSGDDVDWGEDALSANPCPRVACPTGKTTTARMPIGAQNCKYTSDTKFCDAKGCFNINDAASGDWTWSY